MEVITTGAGFSRQATARCSVTEGVGFDHPNSLGLVYVPPSGMKIGTKIPKNSVFIHFSQSRMVG